MQSLVWVSTGIREASAVFKMEQCAPDAHLFPAHRWWSLSGCWGPLAARTGALWGSLLQFALNFSVSVTFSLCQTQLKFSSSQVTGKDGQATAEQKTVLGLILANCTDDCDRAGCRNSLVLIWPPILLLHGYRAAAVFLSLSLLWVEWYPKSKAAKSNKCKRFRNSTAAHCANSTCAGWWYTVELYVQHVLANVSALRASSCFRGSRCQSSCWLME